MNGFSDEFMEFLRTNHTTDYYKARSDDVKSETLSRIYGDYSSYFNIWIKVPESIRLAYGGRVPAEIMEYAAQGNVEALRNIQRTGKANPPQKDNDIEGYTPPSPAEIVAMEAFSAAIVAGYSIEAAQQLAENRHLRNFLSEKAEHNTLSPKERELWRKSRESDKETIQKDWHKHSPEKMLLHLFSQFNRGKISSEEFCPQVAELLQNIQSANRRGELLEYLRSKPIQAKLAHFRSDVKELFSQTVLSEIPPEKRREYLRHGIPQKLQLRQLIDKMNNGQNTNLTEDINFIIKDAQKDGIGVDLTGFGADSHHPMPAQLRQMLMVACCVNNVAYRCPDGERINLNSSYVKTLPQEIQAFVASRDLMLAKKSMLQNTPSSATKQQLSRTMASVILAKQGRSF